MISDFAESLIRVDIKDDEELKNIFSESICRTTSLKTYFLEIIAGEKDLSDMRFTIDMMREVVLCLADSRSKVSDDDKHLFEQFVDEYKGNIAKSTFEIAIDNSVHEILIQLKNKIEDGTIEQADVETLRCYCDKGESALMELFNLHKYVLMYEIITVGRVEANRQRYKSARTINHELITKLGLFLPTEIEYGKDFAENYSVLLVSHRLNYLTYLSLSPFMINVGPFLEEDKSLFFFLTGKVNDFIRYDELDEKTDPTIRIHASVEIRDNSFLRFNTNISQKYNKRANKQAHQVRVQFAKVRDQYLYWEEKTRTLIELEPQIAGSDQQDLIIA